MAASGYTPIQLYRTATAAAVPVAGNLNNGELAINYNDGILYYKDSSGVVKVLARQSNVSGSGTANYIPKFTTSSAIGNSVIYDNGTNVGIGTASPSNKLDVNGNVSAAALIPSGSTVPSNGMYLSAANTLNFATNTTNRLSISSTGAATFTGAVSAAALVPTGTTVPTDGMYLAGTSLGFSVGSAVRATISNSGNFTTTGSGLVDAYGYTLRSYTSGPPTYGITSPGGTSLALSTNGAYRITIDSSGNVGIGTSSPSKKLDVNGDALINGITVGRGSGNDQYNVAVGRTALFSNTTTAGYNTAVGEIALYSNTSGIYNTGIGSWALTDVTTGSNNTALGEEAGIVLTTGSGNVCIGVYTQVSTPIAQNQIIIGAGTGLVGVGNNYVTIGASGTNNIYANFNTSATWTKASDERIKRNIQSSSLGLSFINKLRPVTFQWKPNTEYPENIVGYHEDTNTQDLNAVMHGMVAQEVKAALDSEGVENFAGWHERQSDGLQGVSNEMFVLPLINAVKELKAELDALKAELQALKGN